MNPHASDLALILDAAREAGALARDIRRKGLEIEYKADDNTPVTNADLATDKLLTERLRAARPDYGWLSEETRDTPERLGKTRLWVVDSIDGTNSFVAGIPEFAISVGLVDRGRAVIGVVFNPVTGELYHAVAGGGAFLNGAPIHVSRTDEAAEVRRIAAARSEMGRGEFDHFTAPWQVSPLGSTAYKMAKVAEGRVDVFVSAGSKAEWDVAGAAVVVAEAGGRVTRLDGAELRYNQPDPAWRGIVASNGLLHDAVLAMIPSSDPSPSSETAVPPGS
jgi:myo-inositol-1(or 4)-monophosphatase